ncbi:normocyte-binding protein [Wukongibacter baidiensis]|uniref:normocyte-binding protein n=1 Tax=Wukongibacter baidiensis TaxID=1723361 RepID=UPI003D7FBF3A
MLEKIHNRINDMENLKDRALLKELLNGIFIPLCEHDDNMYKKLEQRIFDEIEYNQKNFSIYTTIVSKKNYDPIHYFLHPMKDDDTYDQQIDYKSLFEESSDENKIKVNKVLFQCDYLELVKILNENNRFKGTIKTDINTYEAEFVVTRNNEYHEIIEKMYKIFMKNSIPWRTINAPYISKIVDVNLVEYDEKILEEEIEDIVVDFKEYSKYVKYDMVPLWNIEGLVLKSTGFPVPCEDKINFEHLITLEEESESGYLLDCINEEIKNVRQTKNTLIITAKEEDARAWNVFRIVKKKDSKLDRYDYALFSNSKNISFIEKFVNYNNNNIKTKAELMRIINAFELNRYLTFKDVYIEKTSSHNIIETYNMNEFIADEIRDFDSNKRLVLEFQSSDKSNFIIRDILSFIISEIQVYYPEYICEGRLI